MSLRIVNEQGIDDLVSLGNLTKHDVGNADLRPTPGDVAYLVERFREVLRKYGWAHDDLMDDIEVVVREHLWGGS